MMLFMTYSFVATGIHSLIVDYCRTIRNNFEVYFSQFWAVGWPFLKLKKIMFFYYSESPYYVTVMVKHLTFSVILQYQNVFGPLVKLEADYDKVLTLV